MIYQIRPNGFQEDIIELVDKKTGRMMAMYRVSKEASLREVQDELHPEPEAALYLNGTYITGQTLGMVGVPQGWDDHVWEIHRQLGWMPDSFLPRP